MADASLEKTAITLDDLLRSERLAEIIDGEMVEMMAAGGTHHLIAGNFYRPLDAYARVNNLGTVFMDGLTYLMFSDPRSLKDSFVPDVSFIRTENVPADWDVDKPHPGVPDLAVEVISPGDSADDILGKVRTYLNKGSEQVWVTYPSTREVHQYRRDHDPEITTYTGSKPIDTGGMFPGLELTADIIFELPPWAIKDKQK